MTALRGILATSRMRSSACDTISRLCVRPVLCWFAFPLVSALGSTGSAADRSALFVGFTATMAESDSRVAKKLKLQERRAVIPSRRSLAACRPLGFLGRSRAPSRIGGHTRGTYGVGTYPGLHHGDGGP